MSAAAASSRGVGAGALVLAIGLPEPAGAQENEVRRRRHAERLARRPARSSSPIGEDGIVTVTCHRSEMGQGVRTAIPMVVADELEADWAKVRVAQAPGDEAALRQPGHRRLALARATSSCRCAAPAPPRARCWSRRPPTRWGVPAGEVRAANHAVTHTPSGRTLGYGALAGGAATLPVPARDEPEAEGPVGLPLHRQGHDRRSSTTATSPPARPSTASTRGSTACSTPSSRARRSSAARSTRFDAAETMKVPGVVKVVAIDAARDPVRVPAARRRRGDRDATPGRRSRAARR